MFFDLYWFKRTLLAFFFVWRIFMEDTIVAIATSTAEAGIGIVRASGEKSIEIVKKI